MSGCLVALGGGWAEGISVFEEPLRGRPANASGALSFDIKPSNAE